MIDNYNTGDRPFISYGDRIRDLEQKLAQTQIKLMEAEEQLQTVTTTMFEHLALMHQRVKLLEKDTIRNHKKAHKKLKVRYNENKN